LEYRLDASTGSYTALGTNFTLARQIADFPDETAAVQADLKVILNNQASTDTAEVVSVALHHRLQTPLRKIHPFTILCADGLTDRQGKPLLIGADEIRRVLEAAADPEASPGSITAVLPDERSYQVAVVTYGVTQAWDNRRQVREAIKVGLIELQALNTYGTYEKLEAAPLYSDLESFTYEDLSRL
jgi:hypothetical protein